MSLVTRCPKCQSAFEVTADLLKLHDGLVRCGQCSHVFDGFAQLQAALPTLTRKVEAQQPAAVTARPTSQVPTPAAPSVFRNPVRAATPHLEAEPFVRPPAQTVTKPLAPSVFRTPDRRLDVRPDAGLDDEPSFGALGSDQPRLPVDTPIVQGRPHDAVRILGETRLRGDDPSASGRSVPEFMEEEEPPPTWSRPLWSLGSLLLLTLLLAQLLFVFRNDVAAASPGLRDFLTQACRPLGCEVDYPRRIERVFIVGASLQQAPGSAGAANDHRYVLKFTLQNRFDQDQQWPSLMVQLSDSSGTAVIRKALSPSQYLPADWIGKPFRARQEASLEMPLTVAGSPISGFELTKFFP